MAEAAAVGTAEARSPKFDPALVPGVIGAELARQTAAIDGVLNAFRRTRSITRSQMGTLRSATAAIQRISMYSQQLSRLAGGRLRQDQELACDAAVAARFPQARRCYAGAMLKAQLGEAAPRQGQGALGCGWRSVHPLKQRIHMLNNQSIGKYRRRLGAAGAALLALLTAAVVWAAQPPAAPPEIMASSCLAPVLMKGS